MSPRIYLDNNSSTPLDPRLITFLTENLCSLQGNPSSSHFYGKSLRRLLSIAREQIAGFLKVRPNEIIFTSNGTESVNMIIRGLTGPIGHILTSSVEHSCTFSSVKVMEQAGWAATYLSPGFWGAITPSAVLEALQPNTKLIALMAVNNETGVKTDIEAIAQIAAAKKIPFLVDAVALLGKEAFYIPEGVSAMAFSGHKIHALQGTGFAFIRSNFKLAPLLVGGEQEFGRRAGTENVLGILALGKSINLLASELEESSLKMLYLRNLFENMLISHLSNVLINGEGPRICNVSNLAFSGLDGESLLIALDQAGISASHGSACASGSLEPSRVLLNMGFEMKRVLASIRFSLSRFTTEEEIHTASGLIIDIVRRINML
jgi:cysteine desulfurase